MRKTKLYKVTTEGRDFGKMFALIEMPAMKAERWALRALLALAHSGVDLPEGAQGAGMASIAHAGLKALNNLDYAEVEPLLNEMWDCVRIIPDPKSPEFTRPLMMHGIEGDDIEEIATILNLRQEVFDLHTDFFSKGKR